MSLPLLPLDGEEPQQAPEKAPAAPQPELKAEAEDAVSPEEHAETELTEPEATADKLHRMSAELTLRCVLGGILAVVLLHFGLVSDGLLPAMAALDPDAAPAAFYAANLLLLAASLCVGFPVLRDGLNGLRGRSSSETMPALAAVAALVQAVTAMLNANVYRGTTGISLLSGMAALGLFLALLGSRVMLAAVKGGYELVTNGVEFEGAYRAKDKDLLRALARDLEQKDPWVLLSRPMKEADGFVEQSLSERASERRARKVSYILLGVALLSGVLFLLAGAGWNKAAAAMAAVLCMGAPLSSTLIAGVASLRLQRAAAAVGAVVPGWQAIEQLGGIDTLQIDADDLFTADSAQLEDIRIFKGGRIDRAILYAASVLNESHGTLKGLFRQIVEERTDILFPVKDLEQHHGLGFSAWCDNNRIPPLSGAGGRAAAGRGIRDAALEERRAANFVSGCVRQSARYVRAEICGRAQCGPQPCRAAKGEHPPVGHMSGPQSDCTPHYRSIPPAGRHDHRAGSGAVQRHQGRTGRPGGHLLHDPSQGVCQPDRRPSGCGSGPERREQRHHGTDGLGAVLHYHCSAAHQCRQHLGAFGGNGADVSGSVERLEHCCVCTEAA